MHPFFWPKMSHSEMIASHHQHHYFLCCLLIISQSSMLMHALRLSQKLILPSLKAIVAQCRDREDAGTSSVAVLLNVNRKQENKFTPNFIFSVIVIMCSVQLSLPWIVSAPSQICHAIFLRYSVQTLTLLSPIPSFLQPFS